MTNKNSQQGQMLLLTIVFMFIIITLVASLLGFAGVQIKGHKQAVAREEGLSIAEAGVELAIWKMNNVAGYSGETNTAYANGVYSVTLTSLSSSSKLIKVDSYIPNATNPTAHRTVQLTANIGTENIGFNYGVQSGQGGFQIDNNATVVGNVYSNGLINGDNGSKITGDTTSVSSITNVDVTGNINSDTIVDSIVSGNTRQHTSVTNSIIGGTAWSDVFLNSSVKCKITGAATYKTTHSGCTAASWTQSSSLPAVPPPIPMPISAAQMTAWENEGAAGGVTNGDVTITGTQHLGPRKISGNLFVNGDLIIDGTLWVTGSITMANGSTIELNASYANLTGVVLAGTLGSSTNGYIDASNNSELKGSGVTGSYLLLISEMANTTSNAIVISNNAISAIIYAGTGVINVLNNAQLREVTAYKIHINQNVVLTPSSGTTNAEYFSGSSGGWEVLDQTWQLLL